MPAARICARENHDTIHTNLGELVAAISDVAFEYAPDPEEAYEIARLVLLKIMKNRPRAGNFVSRRLATKVGQ